MLDTLVGLIPTLGFPIVCVIALAAFVVYIYKDTARGNESLIARLQEQCDKREEKLYNEIAECRSINSRAIETIATYAEKLNNIQQDVSVIKSDIIEIKSKQ